MTWNTAADSRVNVTAWTNGEDGTVTLVVGNQNAILDERLRQQLAQYLLNGTSQIAVPVKEYESLIDDQKWRIVMESWGVDNWVGYDEAISEFYGEGPGVDD